MSLAIPKAAAAPSRITSQARVSLPHAHCRMPPCLPGRCSVGASRRLLPLSLFPGAPATSWRLATDRRLASSCRPAPRCWPQPTWPSPRCHSPSRVRTNARPEGRGSPGAHATTPRRSQAPPRQGVVFRRPPGRPSSWLTLLSNPHACGPRKAACGSPARRTGPSAGLMPNSVTMRRARSVARARSSEAPVETSSKVSASAARPPSITASRARSSLWLNR